MNHLYGMDVWMTNTRGDKGWGHINSCIKEGILVGATEYGVMISRSHIVFPYLPL